MYESLYGLSRRPFAPTPDLAFYVPNESAEAALETLEHTVREDLGIGILTGDVGLGKTLVCQNLAERLADEFTVVSLPSANYPSLRALLQAILYEIGHPYTRLDQQELRLELQSALRELSEETRGLVLIVDEANFLSDAMLEEVRTLTHLAIDGVPMVRVVLSAHMSFEERLIERQMEALNQRIGCHVFLEPLSHEESITYVVERLQLAGTNVDGVFSAETMLAISQASGGVPRCLNQLCDHTLLLGYAMQEQPISVDRVHEALEDLKPLPLQWNNVPNAPIPSEHVQFCEESFEDETADSSFIENVDSAANLETEAVPSEVTEEAAVFEFGNEYDDNAGVIGEEIESPAESTAVVETPESSVFEVGGEESVEPAYVPHAAYAIESTIDDGASDTTESSVIEFGSPDEPMASESLPEPATNTVEHSVIVPPLPSWKENPVALETERIRQAVGPYAWSFAEETIRDRYAALDSGRPVPTMSVATVTTSICPTEKLRREEACWLQPEVSPWTQQSLPVEWIEDAVSVHEDESKVPSSYGDPLKTIDEILPQVDSVLNDDINFEQQIHEPVSPDGGAADVLQSVRDQIDSFHQAEPDLELEAEIGALVLDTCISTQTELYGSPRNREVDQQLASALQDTLTEKLGSSSPDVSVASVKPKVKSIAEQLAEAQSDASETSPPKRTRKYGSLFTKLRRKLRS